MGKQKESNVMLKEKGLGRKLILVIASVVLLEAVALLIISLVGLNSTNKESKKVYESAKDRGSENRLFSSI